MDRRLVTLAAVSLAPAALETAWTALSGLPRAWEPRGTLLLDLADLDGAIDALTLALKDLPHDEVLHYKLAEAYRRSGQPEQARQHLQTYQRIHTARLEIGNLEAQAVERPLSAEERARLTKLRRPAGQ